MNLYTLTDPHVPFHPQNKNTSILEHTHMFPWATGRERSPCLIFSLPVKFVESARTDDTQVSSPAERISSSSSGLPRTSTHHSTLQSTVTPRGMTLRLQHAPKNLRGDRDWTERHQGKMKCDRDRGAKEWWVMVMGGQNERVRN